MIYVLINWFTFWFINTSSVPGFNTRLEMTESRGIRKSTRNGEKMSTFHIIFLRKKSVVVPVNFFDTLCFNEDVFDIFLSIDFKCTLFTAKNVYSIKKKIVQMWGKQEFETDYRLKFKSRRLYVRGFSPAISYLWCSLV